MKLFVCLMLLGSAAFAAKPAAKVAAKPQQKSVYQIVMETSIDGIKSSSALIIEEGRTGSISNVTENLGGTFQEVVVNKTVLDGKPALRMEFVVGEVDRFGNKAIISTPKIIAAVGEKSTIMIGSAANGKKLIFSALAKSAKK